MNGTQKDTSPRIISVSELKARLSECLRHVKQGESWMVTERGRIVAVLGPSPAASEELEALAAQGVVRLGRKPLPEGFWEESELDDPGDTVRSAVTEERFSGW